MKRTLSLLLSLALLLGLLAVPAWAAEEEKQAEEDVSAWVLQAGGLFPQPEPRRGGLRSDPYAAVKQAIYEALRDQVAETNISTYRISPEELSTVYAEVVNDHPELFYVKGGYTYYYNSSGVTRLMPNYYEGFGDEEIAEFEAKCEEVLAGIDEDWGDVQKLLYLHDYLVTHCEYDKTYTYYDAYHALVTGSAVCQGYTLALCCLGKEAGLEVMAVTSEDMNHAWNLVQAEGEYAYIDSTWDDPSNDWYEAYCGHENFLRSQDGITETGHDSSDWVCGKNSVYETETTDEWEDAWWSNVITPIPQLGDLAAYALSDEPDYVHILNLSEGSDTAYELDEPSCWLVWGDKNGRYWASSYCTLALLGSTFYFTTPTRIFSLTEEGIGEEVYTLTAEERELGYIYGIVEDGGSLYYTLGQKYNEVEFTRTLLPLDLGPEILEEPEDVTVTAGETAVFTVLAAGEDLSYQWYYRKTPSGSWVAVKADSGKTATYTLTAAAKHNGYQYYCEVSDGEYFMETDVVTLTVETSLEITGHPVDATVTVGQTASFTVTVSGANLSYQWYVQKTLGGEWTPVAKNGTAATYSLTTASRHNGYRYKCLVEDGVNSAESSVVTLTVTAAASPVIAAQPVSVTVSAGETAVFSVTATGSGLSYQWYVQKTLGGEWSAIKSGAKAATYRLVTAAKHNGYKYKCVVTGDGGTAVSDIVTLTVASGSAPTIRVQPENVTVAVGDTAVFTVTAAGSGLTYQWYVQKTQGGEWSVIKSGAKAATYRLVTAAKHNGYRYKCIVTGEGGTAESDAVTLSLKPGITAQPVSVTVNAGETATFTVAAAGSGLTYQWYVQKTQGGEWSPIKTGSKSATYNLVTAAKHNGYRYKCIVTNAAGSTESTVVTLTVS